MSNQFALIKNGDVVNIVTTRSAKSVVRQKFPNFQVLLLSEVPQAALERYRYWDDRP